MHNPITQYHTKQSHYQTLAQQLNSLLIGEPDWIANCSQFSALLFHSLPDLNWAGFYLAKDDTLVLGPFQGKPACIRIALGKGACGVSAQKREPVIIQDVYTFPGYIACDEATRSEIVLPLIKNQFLLGVLDLDSPLLNRFDETDRKGLQNLIDILLLMSAV
jgi:L-methionine (R)-S-oxide reductase